MREGEIESDLRLRSMTDSDIDRVVAIEREAFGDAALEEWEFWCHLTLPNEYALVAERDGEIVGSLLYAKRRGELYVSNLAVARNARRSGIGGAMMRWVLEQMKTLGQNSVALHVAGSNFEAIQLYTKLGFVEVDRVPSGYPDGSDAIEMVHSARAQTRKTTVLSLIGARRG